LAAAIAEARFAVDKIRLDLSTAFLVCVQRLAATGAPDK